MAVKTNHSFTPLKKMETIMAKWPRGSYLVLEAEEDENGEPMGTVFVGYRYNNKKTLYFIMSKEFGSTVPDPSRPYYVQFRNQYRQLDVLPIARPACISDYFEKSNVIDTHNQLRQ